jgi:hypothetical protein
MAYTYSIKNGELILQKGKPQRFNDLKRFACKTARIAYYLMVFSLTYIVVWAVYKSCINEPLLERTITLGAIFATLGASIVSIISLFCKEQYSQFNDNVRILQSRLIESEIWERWPFVKRVVRRKIVKGSYEYKLLNNPCIVFTISSWRLTAPLPASKSDFFDLPICRTLFLLIYNSSRYYNLFSKHVHDDAQHEILVWDCLVAVYKNIMLYKLGYTIILFGINLVFISIAFSFFYFQCMGFFEFLVKSTRLF